YLCLFLSSRRRHTTFSRDWSSDVCSSDLEYVKLIRACWDNDPLRRPPFENVSALLEELIEAYNNGATKVGPSSEMALPDAQRGKIGRASCRRREQSARVDNTTMIKTSESV